MHFLFDSFVPPRLRGSIIFALITGIGGPGGASTQTPWRGARFRPVYYWENSNGPPEAR